MRKRLCAPKVLIPGVRTIALQEQKYLTVRSRDEAGNVAFVDRQQPPHDSLPTPTVGRYS